MVSVTEYPEEFINNTPEEDRFNGIKSMVGVGLEAKITNDRAAIEQAGHKGRELIIEAANGGQLKNRIFWVGRRQYAVMVAFVPKYLNYKAADYFLDSLQIGE
jgi:hypothetical protein